MYPAMPTIRRYNKITRIYIHVNKNLYKQIKIKNE